MSGGEIHRLRSRPFGTERMALKGATLLVSLAALSVMGQSWALVPVKVEVDGQVLEERVLPGTVGHALAQLGVRLGEHDLTIPAVESTLQPGLVISVKRAFPVSVRVDGAVRTVYAATGTVGELLADAGIELDPLDYVEPQPTTPVEPGLMVRVVRVREEIVVRQETVPYRTLRWADPALEQGRTRVLREGREGLVEHVERLRYEDGRLVSTTRLQSRVVRKPQDKIIGIGTKVVWRTLQTPYGIIRYRKALQMVATAYYPGPESTGKSADGLTATGMRAGRGVVAVDPRVIPLGTRLYIPGYGMAIAADVGAAIKGYRIDLCFNTLREAIQFGRRTVTVYVLD